MLKSSSGENKCPLGHQVPQKTKKTKKTLNWADLSYYRGTTDNSVSREIEKTQISDQYTNLFCDLKTELIVLNTAS